MNFDRTGIILYTINYEACVRFYGKILGLRKLFQTQSLTCFEFGASYLMVEVDDESSPEEIAQKGRTKTCLRMNVPDVKSLADQLRNAGVEVDYQSHEWGTVAKFYDPDGNLCAFKDSEKFEKQVQEYRNLRV